MTAIPDYIGWIEEPTEAEWLPNRIGTLEQLLTGFLAATKAEDESGMVEMGYAIATYAGLLQQDLLAVIELASPHGPWNPADPAKMEGGE